MHTADQARSVDPPISQHRASMGTSAVQYGNLIVVSDNDEIYVRNKCGSWLTIEEIAPSTDFHWLGLCGWHAYRLLKGQCDQRIISLNENATAESSGGGHHPL